MRFDFSHTRIIIRSGTTTMLASEEQQHSLQQKDDEIAETVAGEGPYKEVKVREYIRRKCGRKPIDDSIPTKQIYHDIPEEEKICACGCKLLAYTMTNKFCEHLPFYRQEKAFERRCITVTRADMSNWQEQIYKRLKPMDKLIMNHIKSGNRYTGWRKS